MTRRRLVLPAPTWLRRRLDQVCLILGEHDDGGMDAECLCQLLGPPLAMSALSSSSMLMFLALTPHRRANSSWVQPFNSRSIRIASPVETVARCFAGLNDLSICTSLRTRSPVATIVATQCIRRISERPGQRRLYIASIAATCSTRPVVNGVAGTGSPASRSADRS